MLLNSLVELQSCGNYGIMIPVWCIMLVITLFEGGPKNLPIVQMTLCVSASSAQVGVDMQF